jgi:O-antigen/teichoic acid export membrane protein
MIKTGGLFKNLILNNTSQGLQFGSRWLFNITLLNVLDIKNYAVFSFVYSVSNILMAVIPFGSPIFLIHETKDIEKSKNSLFDSFILATFLFTCITILYFVLSPFLNYVKGWEISIYGIILGYILSLNIILFSYFKGAGDFLKELKSYIVFFIMLIIFISYLFFINDGNKNLDFIFTLLIIINGLVFITAIFSNKTIYSGLTPISLGSIKQRLKRTFFERKYFGYQEIVTAIYTQSGLLLLFYLLDTETYGYYRALFVIISPIYLITVSMSQVVLNYLKNLRGQQLLQSFRKLQFYSFLVGLGMVTTLFLFKDFVFQIIKVPMSALTMWAFIIVLSTALTRFVFANYEVLLIVFDKQKFRFYIVFFVAIINIILVFTLLPKYGLIGAVSTNLLTYSLLLIGLLYFTENLLRLKKK